MSDDNLLMEEAAFVESLFAEEPSAPSSRLVEASYEALRLCIERIDGPADDKFRMMALLLVQALKENT